MDTKQIHNISGYDLSERIGAFQDGYTVQFKVSEWDDLKLRDRFDFKVVSKSNHIIVVKMEENTSSWENLFN